MIRKEATFGEVEVSPLSTGWKALLYKDGEGKESISHYEREYWVDESGVLHVLLAYKDADDQLVAAKSKHWQFSHVEIIQGESSPISTSVNWVNSKEISHAQLIVDDLDAPESLASLVLISTKAKGKTRRDVFTGTLRR